MQTLPKAASETHNAYFTTLFAILSTIAPWRKERAVSHKETSTLA